MTTSTSSGRRGIRLGYRANLVGISALGVILLWVVVALFAPHMIPHSVGEIVDTDYFGPVSRDLWLGSDYLGRDIFSRILMGARYTLGISLAAVSIACFSGVALGMTAAVAGGWLDTMLSRFLDALNSIPSKLFGLVVVAAVGSSGTGRMPVIVLPSGVGRWRGRRTSSGGASEPPGGPDWRRCARPAVWTIFASGRARRPAGPDHRSR